MIVSAPSDHPVIDAVRTTSGKIIDQDAYEGTASMYHIPDPGGFLKCILPELARRAVESGCALPLELGICVDDNRWLIHIDGKHSRVELEKLSRRYLTVTQPTLVRLLMGHTDIAAASDEEGFIASTSTAVDAARILFQPRPIWRSPLDGAATA